MKATPASSPASVSPAAPPASAPVSPPAEPLPRPVESASPPGSPASAHWPGWFGTVDLLAFLLVIVTAFLVGSFAARNSDVWLHLASGQRLIAGSHTLGSDPFTYTAADRVWVNSSWLYDAAFYLIYRADESGGLLVGLKAAAFALALAVTGLLRRPGQALWPWAVVMGLALLAAAPQAALRPEIGSMLFLALTLVTLYCCPWQPGSWRKPIACAVLFLIWTNTDEWFFLGPLVLALVLIGELVQTRLFETADTPNPNDPFPAAPPVSGLAKALLLGVIASLLNPTLLMGLASNPAETVAQLVPAELGWTMPAAVVHDPLFESLTQSPIDEAYVNSPSLGYNHNGVAAALLLVGGAIVLAAGYTRLRASQILLWIGTAALALESYRLIPFFAIVAVPLVAAHLNGLAGSLRLGASRNQGTRILLTAAIVSRLLMIVLAIGLLLAAWPGWLHGTRLWASAAYAQRVEWAIIPDPGLMRAAQQTQSWREGDSPALAADVRGLQTNLEFGNYLVWFAPAEPVFATSRYTLHRQELADLATVRHTITESQPDPSGSFRTALEPLTAIVDRYNITYLTLTSVNSPLRIQGVFQLLNDPDSWSLWHLDGRSAFLGRTSSPLTRTMQFNPVRLAYKPDVEPVPEHTATFPIPAKLSLFDQYVARPEWPSFWADDTVVYHDYGTALAQKQNTEWQIKMSGQYLSRAGVTGATLAWLTTVSTPPPPPDAALLALPLLESRAARRAIAETPDRPEGYRALAIAYRSPYIPDTDPSNQQLQAIAAHTQFLERLPSMESRTTFEILQATESLHQLAILYEQTGQFDLARESVKAAITLVKWTCRYNPGEYLQRMRPDQKIDDLPATVLKSTGLDALEERITQAVSVRNDQYQQIQESRKLTPSEKFQVAVQLGFTGQAIEQYNTAADGTFDKDLFPITLQLIMLELRAGRLAQAVTHLEQLESQIESQSRSNTPPPERLRSDVRNLRILAYRLEGNFQKAGEEYARQFAGVSLIPLELMQMANPSTALAAGAAASSSLAFLHLQSTIPIRESVFAESMYYHARGIFALLAGHNADAPKWFEQSLRPRGFDITTIGGTARDQDAETYLRLLREAATPSDEVQR